MTWTPHDRDTLSTMVEDAQEEFYDLLDDIEPSEPTTPDEDALPENFLHGKYSTAVDIANYLTNIELRWRLDALMAVEDYLDGDNWTPLKPMGSIRRWIHRRRFRD